MSSNGRASASQAEDGGSIPLTRSSYEYSLGKSMVRIALILFAILSSAALMAAILQSVEVRHEGRRYHLVSESYLSAPIEEVFKVLVDYEQFEKISSIFTDAGYMDPDSNGDPVVYTTIRGCVLFFCKSFHRIERLELSPPVFIRATVLPEQSDFLYSVSEWELESRNGGTFIKYSMEMEPDFWVPPVIGPWAIKMRLERDARPALDRLESAAQENTTASTAP